MTRRRFIKTGLGVLGTGCLITYPYIIEPSLLMKEEVSVEIEGLPEKLKGKKILHLSDFHFRRNEKVFEKLIDIIPKNDYDIVCYTGDFVEHRRHLPGLYEILKEIPVRKGAFAVLGNWEHWGHVDGEKLRRDLATMGIDLLINEGKSFYLGGEEVSIYGVDDPSTGFHDLQGTIRSIRKRTFSILLSHAPCIVDVAMRLSFNFSLILTGHTHGGQIRLPLIGPLWLPKGSSRYVSGLYRIGKNMMYVSRGVGTSLFPVRFLCPPEVTLIILERPS